MPTVSVILDHANDDIAGFCTPSMISVELTDLPEHIHEKLPRHPNVPAVLLGRLGRDLRFRGRGCGDLLVSDALKRSCEACSRIAAFAIVVDAKNAKGEAFYGSPRPFVGHRRHVTVVPQGLAWT